MCGKSGIFENELDMDAWTGFQKTRDSHNEASPNCEFVAWRVRVQIVE